MNTTTRNVASRNLALDFFRGLALMIIFINHMPLNPWFAYTPSRLGPSDAAEMFVFLSGFAAAIAFGRSFKQAGLGLGSARVLFRCGQIYLAHLILFILMSSLLIIINQWHPQFANWQLDNLNFFFEQTPTALLALLSLKYVPNFIDILPMYLIIMLWLPMVWALSRIHTALALAFPLFLYLAARHFGWELTADPLSGRSWYFNPFCWQLVFFTGFAFSSGWLSIPAGKRWLMSVCLAYVIFCFPLENAWAYNQLPWFANKREAWAAWLDKSHLGMMRYLHFLAMTYLVTYWLRQHPNWLQSQRLRPVMIMGQQSLPIFMLGTCLSFLGGVLIEDTQADWSGSALINLAGIGIMLLMAQVLNWLDQKPWKNVTQPLELSYGVHWPKQAMLACSLTCLTIAPLIFLQTTPSDELTLAVATPSEPDVAISGPAQLNENVDHIDTQPAAFEAQDHVIDLPDSL